MRKIILIFSILFIILCSVSCTSNSASLSKEAFEQLKIGDTLSQVELIDPNTNAYIITIAQNLPLVGSGDSYYVTIQYCSEHNIGDDILCIKYKTTFEDRLSKEELEKLENYYNPSQTIITSLEWGVEPGNKPRVTQ